MENYQNYRKKNLQPMRPYIPGEDLTGISVSSEDTPEEASEEHTGKTLHNSDASGAHKNVSDLAIVGNGDMFRLLCKASSQKEGWMKSTKALDIGNGCLVQVTTQQRNPDGSYAVAEALAFVPEAQVKHDLDGGRKLVC